LRVGLQSFDKLAFHPTFVDLLLTTHNVSDLCTMERGPQR